MARSHNDTLDAGRRALDAGNPTTALVELHEVLVASNESTLDVYGRAQTWIGECYLALGEGEQAATAHALAITTGCLFAPDSEELQISLKRFRVSEEILDQEPDSVVIATAWKVDAILKAGEGDTEGVVFATRQATSTIATAFGRDHPRQAVIFAHVASALAAMDAERFGPLIAELTAAGLRVVPDGDIACRALLMHARVVERSFALEIAEAIALCDAGLVMTKDADEHAAAAGAFRLMRASLDEIVAKLANGASSAAVTRR